MCFLVAKTPGWELLLILSLYCLILSPYYVFIAILLISLILKFINFLEAMDPVF